LSLCFTVLEGGGRIGGGGSIYIDAGSASGGPGGKRSVAAMANELRQFVDKANAPIFGIDSFGLVNEWNDKTTEITGFSKDEAIGMHLGMSRFP